MRKVVLLEHMSLDGFVAGPNGEMDWIRVDDEELWKYVEALTDNADAAIYGRVTYQMMAGYWPTAAEQPGATTHDVHHGTWVNKATKIVFSKTLDRAPWGTSGEATVVRDISTESVQALKEQPGKDIMLIGSISIAQAFMRLGMIDEYWINVNPVILGSGKPLFANIEDRINLKLVATRTFKPGVVGLHYE